MIDTLVKCKTEKKKMGEMYEFSLSLFRCEVAHSSGASGVFRSRLGLTSWCDPTPACGQDLWCASNDTLRQGVCVILCDDVTVSCKMSVVTLSPSPSSSPWWGKQGAVLGKLMWEGTRGRQQGGEGCQEPRGRGNGSFPSSASGWVKLYLNSRPTEAEK